MLAYNFSALIVTTTGARVLMLDGFMCRIGTCTCMPSFALTVINNLINIKELTSFCMKWSLFSYPTTYMYVRMSVRK